MRNLLDSANKVHLDEDQIKASIASFIRDDPNYQALGKATRQSIEKVEEILTKSDKTLENYHSLASAVEKMKDAAQNGELRIVHEIKVNETRIELQKNEFPSPHLPTLVKLANAGTAICLVGPTGCGKSFVAEQLWRVLNTNDERYAKFGVISLTEGLSETSLFGRQNLFDGSWSQTEFIDIYENGGLFLFDEIDASDPNMLLSVNRAMAQSDLRNPYNGELHKRNPYFLAIAAANTSMRGANALYNGRNRIDAATINRFSAGWIKMDFDPEIEKFLCPDRDLLKILWEIRSWLKERQSSEIISTRTIEYAYNNKVKGNMSNEEIFNSVVCVWSDDLRDSVYHDVLRGHGIGKLEVPDISYHLDEIVSK